MVKGLDIFREYFGGMPDQYVLIGGVAASLTMDDNAKSFRATKDLDVVLILETQHKTFHERLWAFVNDGGYEIKQRSQTEEESGIKSEGEEKSPILYRFAKPANDAFPAQLELFSRAPDGFNLEEGATLTPIPTDEELSSLSAILLDGDYYEFLRTGTHQNHDLSYIGVDRLIPFKARAWIDMTARNEAAEKGVGNKVDSKHLLKHRNDVIKLSELLSPEMAALPESIARDVLQFLERMPAEGMDFKKLGFAGDLDQVTSRIKEAFSL